jgi:hypothetical protein
VLALLPKRRHLCIRRLSEERRTVGFDVLNKVSLLGVVGDVIQVDPETLQAALLKIVFKDTRVMDCAHE